MYIWYINICTVVTLYSIIHSDFGRVCDRSWKCMEVSLHYRAVRRSGIRIDLFAVSSDTWIADHGNGVFGWKGIKKQRCVII